MPSRSGRRERRTPLAVPVQISRFREPSATERTITENVCSGGLRVVAQRQMNPDEALMVSSMTGDLREKPRFASPLLRLAPHAFVPALSTGDSWCADSGWPCSLP